MISKLITTIGRQDIDINGKNIYNSRWRGNYNGENLDLDYIENGKPINIQLNNKNILQALKNQINEDRESPLIHRLSRLNNIKENKIRNRTPTPYPKNKKTKKLPKKRAKGTRKRVYKRKKNIKKMSKSNELNKKLNKQKKYYNHSH
tara:strand:+ start:2160 stop:2600 length:441 start_codon:yes stop_codon:yes gene_type:complete